MNLIPKPIRAFINRATGAETRQLRAQWSRRVRSTRFARGNSVTAASMGGPSQWIGVASNGDEDAANKDYLTALPDVLQRSQDLHVNNPDLRGFNHTRTAQIVGAHVKFKCVPKGEEVGITDPKTLAALTAKIDRIRALHSRTGGFDSTGKGRTEGIQQVRAQLTAFIHGTCLIHKVWRPENPILPLSIELIPGVRISTPYDRLGDPKVSFGIEYSDEHRARIVAFHVRRVSKTIGNSFVPDFTWDRLPIEDCSLLELIEPAGMDRAMPNSVACVKLLKNRSEFMESINEGARAQAQHYMHVECAEGADPYAVASDDADQTDTTGSFPMGFTSLGPTVKAIYTQQGEKVTNISAVLPAPDLTGFNDVTDNRVARGLGSSTSRFTRKVNNSWAGGRLEDQQDDPIVDQYRNGFVAAWQKVNCWFMEALWLTDAVTLPGYSAETAVQWCEFRAQFPGKLHINPADTMNARVTGYMLRSISPQQACEEDGKDFHENLKQWADAIDLTREMEKEHGLKEGTLDILYSGKTVSTSAGDEVGSPDPAVEVSPGEGSAKKTTGATKAALRIAGGGA